MVRAERAAGAAAAIVADLLLGEPPTRVHPVALFGSGMEKLEARFWRDSYAAGLQFALAGVALAVASGGTVAAITSRRSSWFGIALGCAMAGTVTTAGRALAAEAIGVRVLLESGDLERSRTALRALVGRDTTKLDEKEIARAVVESVAENTVDAIIAPVVWTAAFGVPGAFAYRAVNTLDAMVGHKSERYMRFGWASARADDVANWLPSRLTALLVMAARPRAAALSWRAVRSGAKHHPSPNAGVVEAAFAGALGIRLGGDSTYEGRLEQRPFLGYGRPAEASDIERAVRLSRDVSLLLAGALALAALAATRPKRAMTGALGIEP